MEKIKELITDPLQKINLKVDNVKYENKTLYITIDSIDSSVLDVDKVVEATKLIDPLIDKADLIKDSYVLDVSSKERGK